MRFYNTIPEEQETHIIITYADKSLCIYSSRKSVLKRLFKSLGEPATSDFIKESLTGASWRIPLNDKKGIKTALSKTLLIGQIKTDKNPINLDKDISKR